MAEGQSKRPQGVTLLAIYRMFAGAVALLLVGLVMLAALPMLFTLNDAVGMAMVVALLGMASLIVLVYAAISLAVGWGLLKMQAWARWGALVLAVLSLLDFPTGTAVGAVTIWYLTQESLAQEFAGTADELAQAPAE